MQHDQDPAVAVQQFEILQERKRAVRRRARATEEVTSSSGGDAEEMKSDVGLEGKAKSTFSQQAMSQFDMHFDRWGKRCVHSVSIHCWQQCCIQF